MRKTRLRALRAGFKRTFGRMPNGMEVIGATREDENLMAYRPSEMRRLKKAYTEAHRG